MSERLKAIENPPGLVMKSGYWYAKKKYGKVITPLKKIYARLPVGFSLWSNKMHTLERKLPLSAELVLLVRTLVAQLNTCHFCIDISKAYAMQQFESTDKFFAVQEFASSPMFSDEERVALRFASEMTLHKSVTDETYALCKSHFSDEQLVGIGWVVTSEHVYNLMNLTFEIESDGLCRMPAAKTETANL